MVQTFDMAFRDGGYDIYDAVYMMATFYHEMLIQPFNNNKEIQSNCMKVLYLVGVIFCVINA